MNDKSHVSLEQHVCLVCGTAFDTGAILLDKRLRASMERHTATGWGLCPEHQKLSDDGFVALVECDPQRSGSQASGRMKPEQAYRTGRLAHLKREAFEKWRTGFSSAYAIILFVTVFGLASIYVKALNKVKER